MPGILVVHGGAERARRVFARERRGDWSQALPLVLEKHGLLELAVAGPRVLARPAELSRHACVLVGELDPEDWTADAVAAVRSPEVRALLGSPPPPALRAELGATSVGAHDGSFAIAATGVDVHRLARAYGTPPGGTLAPPTIRPVDRRAELDWRAIDAVPLDHAQADAWARRDLVAERWELQPGADVLATWTAEDGRAWPAVVGRGTLLASSFGFFAALGQAHTSEPWGPGEFRSSGRSSGLEAILLGIVDLLHARAGETRARVRPWPGGARWALTVRHDHDRPMRRTAVRAVVESHAAAGTRATWYWRARHLQPAGNGLMNELARRRAHAVLAVVAGAPGQEVAHHTERLWAGADAEEAAIAAATGRAVAGTCAHGDPGCFRYQGAPNVLWAERRGHLYTELIQQAHLHPHRFAALRPNGEIAPGPICLPHHESLDRSSRDGDDAAEEVLARADAFVEAGGLLQVMNHPDINVAALFALLARLPPVGRWDCTAEEAARWWRRTHAYDALRIVRDGDGRIQVTEGGLADIVLEVLEPDGSRRDVPAS